MKKIFLGLAMLALTSCGDDKSPAKKTDDLVRAHFPKSGSRGLVFSIVDKEHQASEILVADFQRGGITPLLRGQSGDPWIFSAPTFDRTYLFNRKGTMHNLYTYNIEQRSLSQSVSFKGNPSAFLQVSSELSLVALYNSSTLVLLDADHVPKSRLRAEDFGVNFLRPVEIFSSFESDPLAREYYLVHQGVNASFTPNATQRIFNFKITQGGKLEALGESWELEASYPQLLSHPGEKRFVDLIGLCYEMSGPKCHGGWQRFDFETRSLKTIGNLDALGIFQNSRILGDFYPETIYVDVHKKASEARKLLRVRCQKDTQSCEIEKEIYTADTNQGIHLFARDPSSGAIWFSTLSASGQGKMQIWQDNKPMIGFDLNGGAAYQGAFY